jgi:hypothetical protein
MAPENTNESSHSNEQLPLWNIGEDQLFDLTQFERDQIFDDRTNRLHKALLALANGAQPDEIREFLEKNS